MKKFTKVALVIATIAGVIGIGCFIGAISLGLTWGTFWDMVDNGKLNIGPTGNLISTIDGKSDGSIVEVEEAFGSLNVQFESGKLEILYDDVDKVQVEQEDVREFRCYVEEATLHVEGGQRLGVNNNRAKIVIRIPKAYLFAEFDLEVGAGEATVDGVRANAASIDVGAGKANITNLDVKEIDASVDAGELHIQVVGKQENYNYNLECDVGTIRIGEESYTGLGNEKKIKNPDAERFLEADCDVGKIQIDFAE